jgi:hypothetical protein
MPSNLALLWIGPECNGDERNAANRSRRTFSDGLCRLHSGHLHNGLTTKITRLPLSDFDFRKRPIGNSGAFIGYPLFAVPLIVAM